MRMMETDTADNTIQNIKYADEGETLRLTFQWPVAIEQVYIFKTGDTFDIATASENDARLYTLQEYKKRGGFIDRKTPGVYTYRVYPFARENGEDIVITQADGQNTVTCLTGQIIIQFSIKERKQWLGNEKINEVILFSEQPVEDSVLCYVKKEHTYPAHAGDGVIYTLGEPLLPGTVLTKQIKTRKDEYIRLFVRDPALASLYKFQMADIKKQVRKGRCVDGIV